MSQPAAKQGDQVLATDVHILLVPSPTGPVSTPTLLPFIGLIDGNLSSNVMIMGRPAATVGSTATNQPTHLPIPPTASFSVPPTNMAAITLGSTTVFINNNPAARNGDSAVTCDDVTPGVPKGKVVAVGTVLIG